MNLNKTTKKFLFTPHPTLLCWQKNLKTNNMSASDDMEQWELLHTGGIQPPTHGKPSVITKES